jgi:hypothetical protein
MFLVTCRTGVYAGHRVAVLQMLVLGDNLLSLGKDKQLLVWKIGQYGAPEVRASTAAAHALQGLHAGWVMRTCSTAVKVYSLQHHAQCIT